MTKVVYSGSFDPITLGHIDILKRALKMFDEVIIAIGVNSKKSPLFSGVQRLELFRKAIADDAELRPNVNRIQIKQTSGLLADFAKAEGADAIVRGVRSTSEFEAETTMGLLNRQLSGIETVLLIADPALSAVSSSAVKEIAAFGGPVAGMVPKVVAQAMVTLPHGATN